MSLLKGSAEIIKKNKALTKYAYVATINKKYRKAGGQDDKND